MTLGLRKIVESFKILWNLYIVLLDRMLF